MDSYYDEFRVFSKKNGFEWKDHPNMCEIPSPAGIPMFFKKPVFCEIKRTSLDEFEGSVRLIDRRDEEDRYILNSLRSGEILYQIKEINNQKQNFSMIDNFRDNFREILTDLSG